MICKYCTAKSKVYDKINRSSTEKAEVAVFARGAKRPEGDNVIAIYAEHMTYNIPAIFCPVCGRDLTKPPAHKTEREYSNIIRENIKRYLKETNMTYTTLSKESGVASSTIGNFLSGKTDYLTVGKLVLIADAFGLPIEKMFLPYGVEQTYEEALDET